MGYEITVILGMLGMYHVSSHDVTWQTRIRYRSSAYTAMDPRCFWLQFAGWFRLQCAGPIDDGRIFTPPCLDSDACGDYKCEVLYVD